MSKPEWRFIGADWSKGEAYYWCKGCGCLKIDGVSNTRYLVPRRERERRKAKK